MIALFPGSTSRVWSYSAFAFIFAWALRAAILEPLAIASLMQVFFKTIEGQTPDPEWKERLSSASSRKFRELAAKASSLDSGAHFAHRPPPSHRTGAGMSGKRSSSQSRIGARWG